MIALFLSDPSIPDAKGHPPTPVVIFDHWLNNSDGDNAGVMPDGRYVVQLEARGSFHVDGPNPDGWQHMERTGVLVFTQNNMDRFPYFWANW